ncbi:prephenate dehydratase [Hymenobacter sp. 15J16-1T3B]|uniref:prephenate dehydratase n=1 Tax=Hymenobacter sp. 15J16-1T3B TaxID=2886941 RepID=UPI001D104ECA|nr:prephenate dehydratase [Hymenobacter sp. 15J16-1T3B]MCC3156245.1 prephenate dehydratase [Hymenobacter sp. 15J16-1T3B]
MTHSVAIQGFAGSFHQIAARHYFGPQLGAVRPCATFGEVVRQVTAGEAATGLMAIENSIAGSILPNYRLLQQADLRITGEVYLQIRQHLMALPGQTLADLREVHSHPMALQQCHGFLGLHPRWRLVETEDTALSAQRIREQELTGVAAVAGELAAQLFGLDIVAPDIHAAADNYTRFLVVQRAAEAAPVAGANKASLYFHTAHRRGALAEVLTRVAARGINLSKLQSFPRPGTTWEYFFHADLEFDAVQDFEQALAELHAAAASVRVLGVYRKGETY